MRGGDYTLALGDIVAAAHLDAAPLTYHLRQFGTHNAFEFLATDGG